MNPADGLDKTFGTEHRRVDEYQCDEELGTEIK